VLSEDLLARAIYMRWKKILTFYSEWRGPLWVVYDNSVHEENA
jgi:hypothetical protein